MDEKQFIAKIFTDSFNLGIESCQRMLDAISPVDDKICDLLKRHFEKLKLAVEDVRAED